MRFAGSVAALAIDARCQAAIRLRRVSIVAEQAGVGNFTAEVRVVWTIVAWAHRPISAALGIPTYRKLDELASLVPMEKGFRMIPGADDIVDALLDDIGRRCLRPPQISAIASFYHGVIAFRG